ncbi:MAG: tetratricopeptide repeat protein [Albidovulum sp.]|nr:tetratricopeptide repeat protein [Albidovulum sp.]
MLTRIAGFLAVVAFWASAALAGPMEDGAEAYRYGDFAGAMSAWLPLAESGDAAAQLNVGILHDVGKGVSQDRVAAAHWYRMAADNGNVPAMFNLGLMYEGNEGVEQDIETALHWFRMAAEGGDVLAQFKLGSYYEYGTHVAQDHREALEYYLMSAAQRHAPSMFRVAALYTNGIGIERNLGEANRWNERADDAQMSGLTSAACNQRSVVEEENCRRTTPRW